MPEEIESRDQRANRQLRFRLIQELNVHLVWIWPIWPRPFMGDSSLRQSHSDSPKSMLTSYVEDNGVSRLHPGDSVPLLVSPSSELETDLEVGRTGDHQPFGGASLSKKLGQARANSPPPLSIGFQFRHLVQGSFPDLPVGLA